MVKDMNDFIITSLNDAKQHIGFIENDIIKEITLSLIDACFESLKDEKPNYELINTWMCAIGEAFK